MRFHRSLIFGFTVLAAALPALSQTPSDTARIIDEGMNRSQVMLTAHELADGIGARLTNSSNMRRAEEWAFNKLTGYGLSNVHRESFEFGLGWDLIDHKARMVTPRPLTLTSMPIAWTPTTQGTIRAPVIIAPMESAAQFAEYRGKLAGKIVLVSTPGTGDEPTTPKFSRLEADDIGKLDQYKLPQFDPDAPNALVNYVKFTRALDEFLASEGAVAWGRKSLFDGKLLRGPGYNHGAGVIPKIPAIEFAAEDYRRLARLAKTGEAPVLEIRNDVRFLHDRTTDDNIIADIRGTDPKAGYVMAGAHLDSWAAGDGAADNAAGAAVIMEAARIIRQLGIRPRRTIRFAFWSGEEQGLFGSLDYVQRHLARRSFQVTQSGFENYQSWRNSYPITPLAGYRDLKAYFNMDGGSGKLRGIYAEGNSAAVPLLRDWLAPFESMGAGSVVAGSEGAGSDHEFFQAVGVPGYSFIQDPLDYYPRVHHSSMDTFDHLKADDLRQAAVVMAGVLVAAANSDKELPRMPLPTQPVKTDPFK